ncbi:MAG: hypothetical protein DWI58_15200 [Chloroflexi bacterium]|nr:MAG: hypothetical protein DWI58_15200 [Chloroflexota bacterium]
MPESNRLEREIEEILGKIEQFPDAPARRKRARIRWVQLLATRVSDGQRSVMRQLSRFSISQVMLASFIIILGSLFFRRAAPSLMAWALYAGIILFVSSFAILMFSRRGSSSSTTKWRGRTVSYQPARPSGSLTRRIQYWWSTRTRR